MSNGDFGNATGWTLDGNIEYATVEAGASVALFQESGEGTVAGMGSRARTYQSGLNFTGAPSIIFRYRLSVGIGTRDAAVPPDSFTATLYDMTLKKRVAPDGNGMKAVTLELSTLMLPTAARLVFNFAAAGLG